jgi:outer membrane protein OmpA-like peptidoglycan-associated protein
MKRIIFLSCAIITAISGYAQQQKNQPAAKPESTQINEPRELSPAVQIYFKVGKSDIDPSESAKLEELKGTLKKIAEYRLVLTGHTDSTGNDKINLELSRDRVDEVFDALVTLGIPDSFMLMRYYGRSKPRENETSKEKAGRNRRVEITIIEKPVEAPKPVVQKVDPCDGDTTIVLNATTSVTLNKCDFKRLSTTNTTSKMPLGINVKKTSDPLGIIKNENVPKIYRKDQGMTWLGILEVSFSVDSCVKNPVEITVDPLDFEAYQKAKIKVLAKNPKDNHADKAKDLSKDVRKRNVKKDAVKFTVKTTCPTSKDAEGPMLLASPEGKSKTSILKDKTESIEEAYVVQESPTIIIPGIKTNKGFEFKYKTIENPHFVFKFTDGSYSDLIPVNDVCKLKTKQQQEKALAKKYNIKPKHVK